MTEPVTNEFLETRVKTLHNRVAATGLQANGLPVTDKALRRSLKDGTVSLVETTINGKRVRIVTTNNRALYRLLQQHRHTLLLPGEILGSAPVYVSAPLKERRNPRGYYKHPLGPPMSSQYIHAEQLGVNDARRMGAKSGRIATSNAGCTRLCISLIGEEFPEFQHVNPQRPRPDPSLGTGQRARRGKKAQAQVPASSPPATASARPTAMERGTARTSLTELPAPARKATGSGLPGPSAAKVNPRAAGAGDQARRGFNARSLVIGVKAWRAARLVGGVLITCFVPLKAIDIVIEMGMALWDREREREARIRREKQRTLEAVFKQGGGRIERGIGAIVNSGAAMQAFINAWDRNKKGNGFQYIRVHAVLTVETQRGLYSQPDDVIEDLTTYRLLRVDVYPTSWAHEFTIEALGEERDIDKSEEENKALIRKGHWGTVRKTARNRALSYTIVPPVITPFDIIVTKINNLFVDVAAFIASFSDSAALEEFKGFNFTYRWDEQFGVALQYPPPLNAAVCEYCLGYLYSAAKRMSRHPLEQQDLEGNLESPQKGWKRRFWLLMSLVDPREGPHGKNFAFFARQIKGLVKSGNADPRVAGGINELYSGAWSIWRDLERIERNISKPEYYYLGPGYHAPD